MTRAAATPPAPIWTYSYSDTYQMSLYAQCSGGVLDDATAGSVTVEILVSVPNGAPDEFGGGGGPFGHNSFSIVTSNSEAETASALDPLSKLAFEGTGPITVAVAQDGDGAVLTIGSTGATDAASVTYTPFTLANWIGSADPGNVDDALDQLVSRVALIESNYLISVDAGDVTYAPTTLADWLASTDPGNVDDALDQLASRVKDIEDVYITAVDAGDVTYTPDDTSDWAGSADPGDVDNALDQLASRVKAIETDAVDASEVTFTPSTAANWTGSADPGDLDDALNQLASRTKTIEDDVKVTCSAYKSGSTQLMANLAYTAVEFDAEASDTHSIHSTSSAKQSFTIPTGKGGTYVVTVSFWANFYTGAGGTGSNVQTPIVVGIDVNGSQKRAASVPAAAVIPVTAQIELAAGDVVQMSVYQGYGADLYTMPSPQEAWYNLTLTRLK